MTLKHNLLIGKRVKVGVLGDKFETYQGIVTSVDDSFVTIHDEVSNADFTFPITRIVRIKHLEGSANE